MQTGAPAEAIEGLSLPARIEAILYLKGRPLTQPELAAIAMVSREEAELALITLITDYAHRDTALEVRRRASLMNNLQLPLLAHAVASHGS